MAEIKFHKAESLPITLNQTHDGVWFIQEGITFKAFIVSGGEEFPLNYDDATQNLEQVLTVGNTTTLGLTTTGGITSNIVNTQTINMAGGYSYIDTGSGYIEDDSEVLILSHNDEIGLTAPVLKLKGMNFPSTAGTNGQVLTTDGTNMSWTTPSSGTTYSAGVGINITSNQISVKQATSSERGGTKIWKGTQSAYDAIPTKDADTIYFIEDLQSAEIAVYSGMVSSLAPTFGGTIIQLDNAVVPLSIWNRTYDWVLSWKDGSGLHTLEDYQGKGFDTIKRIFRESNGAMRIEISFTGTFEVPIPNTAKLTLHLSDDAPQDTKS